MTGQTLLHWLEVLASDTPDAPAIRALDRSSLTYGELWKHVRQTVTQLNEFGLGRNDVVGLVLPNGPEMATAFLAVAATATCAPLNPAYRAQEFDFYLSDLAVKALVVMSATESPAIQVAREHGIPVIELTPESDRAAGLFNLSGNAAEFDRTRNLSAAEDVALVLHTSGTTSRPKIVPLTHRNLCESAANIRRTLQLGSTDCCLNVMPLFHIHGLVAAVLSSLAGGGSVACTAGFYAPDFFSWLSQFKPSWYTAVPTMHQAVLARSAEHSEIIARSPLRLIRSSSAALPPQVMLRLQEVFQVPVIESYGMTEAAHQMASNPLPPQVRKPGSVGPAAGPELGIMREDSASLLPQGEIGEIVIRGANVTFGYANNPEANEKAITPDGWFRTGDQGYLDQDRYLHITGRLKEIINRGGEKISPREIDEVLLGHPDIVQAVTFAIPDGQLGQEVAAAVILRDQADTTEMDIRRFASRQLSDFKVPRRVLVLAEIPKGPTGKLQRIGLAEKLGLVDTQSGAGVEAVDNVEPRNEIEVFLAKIWQQVLGLESIGVHDPFLGLGGDSVTATRLLGRVRDELDLQIALIDFFEAPTIAQQAEIVESQLAIEAEKDEYKGR